MIRKFGPTRKAVQFCDKPLRVSQCAARRILIRFFRFARRLFDIFCLDVETPSHFGATLFRLASQVFAHRRAQLRMAAGSFESQACCKSPAN